MRKSKVLGLVCLVAAMGFAAACESDTAITAQVKSKIATDRSITSSSSIDVTTRDKVVTLTGTAESAVAKERAVALARGTVDVTDVVDRLSIRPGANAQAASGQTQATEAPATEAPAQDPGQSAQAPPPSASTGTGEGAKEALSHAAGEVAVATEDVAITTAVKAKLIANSGIPGGKIEVDTRSGVVTLKGTVRSATEKAQALRLARGTRGVHRVDDQLTVASL